MTPGLPPGWHSWLAGSGWRLEAGWRQAGLEACLLAGMTPGWNDPWLGWHDYRLAWLLAGMTPGWHDS